MVRRQAERAQKVAKKAAQKVVEGARNVDLSKIDPRNIDMKNVDL
ncbi:MAG: hypothetical protein ACPHDV_00560 [Parvibaculales bacterium]